MTRGFGGISSTETISSMGGRADIRANEMKSKPLSLFASSLFASSLFAPSTTMEFPSSMSSPPEEDPVKYLLAKLNAYIGW